MDHLALITASLITLLAVFLAWKFAGFLKIVADRLIYGRRTVSDEVQLAFESGDINQIEEHISNGKDLNEMDKDGLSLWWSIAFNDGIFKRYEYAISDCFEDEKKYPHYEYVLKYLIKKGLDINDVRQVNYFPNERLFKFLIDNGIDVNYKRDSGLTMLHEAAAGSWWEHAEIFLKNNADVNSLDNDSKTPLDLCYEDQPPDEEWHENAKKMENVLRKHGAKRGEELEAEEK